MQSNRLHHSLVLSLVLLLSACGGGDSGSDVRGDGGNDGGNDVGNDGRSDVGSDVGNDVGNVDCAAILACLDDDGCCPAGCAVDTDNDCESILAAPVITAVIVGDGQLRIQYEHAAFDYAEFFDKGVSLGQFDDDVDRTKLLSGLINGVEYVITMKAYTDAPALESAFSNTVTATPVVSTSGGSFSIANMTFEGVPVGSQIIDTGSTSGTLFSGAGTGTATWGGSGYPKTSCTDQNVFEGSRAGVLYIVRRDEPMGDIYSPDMGVALGVRQHNLVKGTEYWERFNMYLPPDFDPNTGVSSLKFFMNGKRDGDGTVRGAMFVNMTGGMHNGTGGYVVTSEWQSPAVVHNFHPAGSPELDKPWNNPEELPAGTPWTRGEWQSFELYCYVTDEVGQATCRFWHNNILAFEINDVTPLVRADGWVDHFKVFPYWNGARDDTVRPKCSTLLPNEPNKILIDNFQATDQTAKPNNFDADGNRFIGGSF